MSKQWDNNHDYHSFANSDEVKVNHLSLSLTTNFETKQLTGQVELTLEYINSQATELWLDTRDLTITAVLSAVGEALEYCLDKQNDTLGQRLNIQLATATTHVVIHYHTSLQAQGLHWLTPEQTSGKQLPFCLASRSQLMRVAGSFARYT